MNKHTETPWDWFASGSVMQGYSQPFGIKQGNAANLIIGVFGDVRGGIEVAEANAEFVVRAVNAHEALVAVLGDSLQAWEGEEDSVKEEHAELIERLRAVLTTVEGKS